MDAPLLNIIDLSKTYKGSSKPALSSVNFQVEAGDFFGILGPNGAGKTTLISIICGLIKAGSGVVNVNGLNIKKNLYEIKQTIGFVPQDIALYKQLTAEENLRFIGRIYGLEEKELKSRIEFYFNEFGLDDARKKRIENFSGGMKRRVNIIAGLLHNPKLLILDEPTVGVDVHSRNLILNKLIEFNNSGMTILYTSHYLEEAQSLCKHYLILDNGVIISNGSLDNLLKENEGKNLESVFMELTGSELRD